MRKDLAFCWLWAALAGVTLLQDFVPAGGSSSFAPPPPLSWPRRLAQNPPNVCNKHGLRRLLSGRAGQDGNTEGENDATKRDLQFHEVPPGGPGDMWRGIPIDKRKLIEERARNRQAQLRARDRQAQLRWSSPASGSTPTAPSSKQQAETFFMNTYRGRGPQQDDPLKDAVPGRRSSANRPPPRSREEMRTLRPTRANSRPRAVIDGLRTLRDTSFFDDPRSLSAGRREGPPGAGEARGRAPGITGDDRVVNRIERHAPRGGSASPPAGRGRQRFPAGIGGEWRDARKTYSEPLNGRTPPLPTARAPAVGPPAAGVMPPSAPFGSRERESAAAAQARLQRREAKLDWARAAAANPRSLPPEAPLTIEDLERTSAVPRATPAGKGPREAGGGSAGAGVLEPVVKSIDPREGDNLVASLKLGETVVHVSHGLCRFRGIEHNAVGAKGSGKTRAYILLEFADGNLCELADKAGAVLTRYLGSGRGYKKKKKAESARSARSSDEGRAARVGREGEAQEEEEEEEEEEDGPALDSLSRPEAWQKRKKRVARAVRKLATDVVKLQALRASKKRPVYPLADGGPISEHVDGIAAVGQGDGERAAREGRSGGNVGGSSDRSLAGNDEGVREEMQAMGFDAQTIERALVLGAGGGKTTSAAVVAADLQATGGKMSRRDAFLAGFPYELTEDQETAIAAIEKDMCHTETPMDRLVCGDVGFGKTEVAFRAILTAALGGRQAIMLAPTTVLLCVYICAEGGWEGGE